MYYSKWCDSFLGTELFNPDPSCHLAGDFCRTNSELSNVPTEEIPTNTTSVNLNNNCIQKLDNNSFTGLTLLVNISLSNNHISDIAPGTFQAQNNVTFLDLSYNNLTSINGTMWEGLDSVVTIRLTGNDIKIIGTNGFSHLPKLKTIVISITVVKTIAKTINADTTFKVAIEDTNTLPCNASSCWLKWLEEKDVVDHYYKDGTLVRPKCSNLDKYWDEMTEVDLNCSREFLGFEPSFV